MHFKSLLLILLTTLSLSSVCFFVSSCDQRDEVAIEALIFEKVEANISAFKKRQFTRCHAEAMKAALEQADSIILAQALAAKDTSHFTRPIKPQKPAVTIPSAVVPVAPLFNEELKIKN